ncbi:helix-turn-helix domain-containing protein [Amorphus sp. 3PC139-8]|uniref:helix-turn-helix domain-containing protein n=1 Tax=Amorphus sp. 3PC139-8 TaxID=2735676 RepID=UPI00345CFBF4
MEQMRANVYRLYPTPAQSAAMARIAGACRFVHNLALEQRRDWWRPGRRFSFGQQSRELTALRRQVDWLRDCPVHALQNALRDVDRAPGEAGPPRRAA